MTGFDQLKIVGRTHQCGRRISIDRAAAAAAIVVS